MEYFITEYENCDVLNIKGRIDSYTAPKIENSLQTLIKKDRNNIILDLCNVSYISSSGILMLVNFQKKLNNKNTGKIIFSNVPDLIYSSFKLAGFDRFFEFFDNNASALKAF